MRSLVQIVYIPPVSTSYSNYSKLSTLNMCTCFLRAVLGQIGLEERAAADARVDWEVGVEQVLKNLDYLDKVCAARFPLFFGNHVR